MSRLPHFLDSWLTDGGKVVRILHWLSLLPGRFLELISVRGRVDPSGTVRMEGCQLQNPMNRPYNGIIGEKLVQIFYKVYICKPPMMISDDVCRRS
jgi:hypothetical protein